MFRFFGGVPRLVVPDNLKSGVHRASFYDPEINRSYGMMASHYGVGILPARPRKPRDKAKVEAGVRFAQTYVDPERAELIAARAVAVSALTYKSIASIIANKLERSSRDTEDAIIEHPNLRGPGYFH
jgi:transposase